MSKKLGILLVLLFFSWVLPSCATTKKEGASPAPQEQSRASYYDFDDILIPSEMTLQKKNSFVYSTSGSKVGHLTFEGRVDSGSLASFFQNNMPKNGWRPVIVFKYKENMLVFLKGDHACVITIEEGLFTTTLGVRVGPIEPAPGQVKSEQSR